MDRAKVKVAFGRDIGDVGGDFELVGEFVDLGRGDGVVDGCQDQRVVMGVVGEVGWLEGTGDPGQGVGELGEAEGDFGVEGGRGDEGYESVGGEEVDEPGCCYLLEGGSCVSNSHWNSASRPGRKT